MTKETRCPECGVATTAEQASAGTCPACMLELGLDQPETRTALAEPLSSATREVRFLPGTTVGRRYRIVSLLGRGGMGEVYRADDLKLGQPVALKFIHSSSGHDHRIEFLLKEVKIARQVSHLNVCRVYDIGEIEGVDFLSMEYVDGEDLSSLLKRIGRLPRDKALQIARQICSGLQAAHDEGILHRDLKPANVMIDGRGRAKITDFGLAGLEESFAAGDICSGTPAYMAPEQFEGKEVDNTVDFYAMGCLAYELLTGVPLFDEPSLSAMITRKMSWSILERSAINANISDELYDVLQKTLSKDPADRLLSPELLGQWAAPLDRDIVASSEWNVYSISRASTVQVDQDDDKPHRTDGG